MKSIYILKCFIGLIISVVSLPFSAIGQGSDTYKFDFGVGEAALGFVKVSTQDLYAKSKGYGFLEPGNIKAIDRKQGNRPDADFIQGTGPLFFTVDVPEGNYRVKVIIGDQKGTSATTVRAESRRLMVEHTETSKGEIRTVDFLVSVRYPLISSTGAMVKLKEREKEYFNWDRQLTLEFNGADLKICGVEITKVEDVITVFLAGNSTVVDQADEPWAAWGQMFPAFFAPEKVVIANHAESGESLLSFRRENRLAKILDLMREGDYLFIEFAHNDQKPGGNHLDPFTGYKATIKEYINETRLKGGIPVLVTSMHRRQFDAGGEIVNTLGDYPEAVRQVAKEEGVALIDLNSKSKMMYEAWGPEGSKKAFVHFPKMTFEGQVQDLADNTHFSTYGAYELAKAVVQGLRETGLELADHLKSSVPGYDPANPAPFEDFYWPLSKKTAIIKPDGN